MSHTAMLILQKPGTPKLDPERRAEVERRSVDCRLLRRAECQ